MHTAKEIQAIQQFSTIQGNRLFFVSIVVIENDRRFKRYRIFFLVFSFVRQNYQLKWETKNLQQISEKRENIRQIRHEQK